MPGYIEFEFNLPGALLAQLVETLDSMDAASLVPASINDIPDAQGVYQLFLDGGLVYIGKTDAEAGLRQRLKRHGDKIQSQIGLDPARVTFRAVRVYVFTAVDLEAQLITRYGGTEVVAWNGSGFGSNDPGRERDTTTYKADHFDALFPIDIDLPLALSRPPKASAAAILQAVKDALPYVIRYQGKSPRSRNPHPDLAAKSITLNCRRIWTARTIIEAIVAELPPGWQATKLLSHMILYKEDRPYPHGQIIARSP
ncbi:MAG: GIY-YIG nuclease family protein [Alphaproteobacteria bacterium]|nr:GIY-YIG nuclease family protein [Alphaproteobacteria bacterium]